MNTQENLSIWSMIGKAIGAVLRGFSMVLPVALIVFATSFAVTYATGLLDPADTGAILLINVLSLLIVSPLTMGQIECSYELAMGRPFRMPQFFEWFSGRKIWWALKVNLYLGFKILLWALVFGLGAGVIGTILAMGAGNNVEMMFIIIFAAIFAGAIGMLIMVLPFILGEIACSKKADSGLSVSNIMQDAKTLYSFCRGKFMALYGILALLIGACTAPAVVYTMEGKAVPFGLSLTLDIVRFCLLMPITYAAIAIFYRSREPERVEVVEAEAVIDADLQ